MEWYLGLNLGVSLASNLLNLIPLNNKDELIKGYNEINNLREVASETANGPGSGGGSAIGHIDEPNPVEYILPALGSLAAFGIPLFSNYKDKVDEDAIRRPYYSKPKVTTSTNEVNNNIKNPKAEAYTDHQKAFDELGYFRNPYKLSKPLGSSLIIDDIYNKIVNFYNPSLSSLKGKKGMKLIPRQK